MLALRYRLPRVLSALLLVISSALVASPAGQAAEEYFTEDFEPYFGDEDVQDLGGWSIVEVNDPVEVGSAWTILNPCGRLNPAGEGGMPSAGQFLISDSDCQSASDGQGTGRSHDIWSPIIEIEGAEVVWLHMNASVQMNNNGTCICDVDVSVDEGETWTNVFRRVAPSRTVEPLPTPDNADGYFGRLHLDVSAHVAGEEFFQFRVRHFEPDWDWWIAIDDVLVDDQPPTQAGEVALLARETFDAGIPEEWTVVSFTDPPNSDLNTWNVEDPCQRSVIRFNDSGFPYQDGHGAHRLRPPFAIHDSDCDPDPAEDEYLITPSIDCTDADRVVLHYDEEIVVSDSSIQQVLLSLDGGETFMIEPLFSFNLGAALDPGEDPYFAERVIEVPDAAGEPEVAFAFHYQGGGNTWWWGIDNVRVTADGDGLDVRTCASREFRVTGFNEATVEVGLAWTALEGDAGFRVLANGEAISDDLPATVDSFVDPAPSAGGEIVYTLQTLDGEGGVDFECTTPPISVFVCPRKLQACVDRSAGTITLRWETGVNVDGRGWRITRNGIPVQSVPFETSEFVDESVPGPGTYEYELSLNGGDPSQCPDLPLRVTTILVGDDILLYESFDCFADDAQVEAAGWQSIATNDAPRDGSEWSIRNIGSRANPPTENGSPSQGLFLISDNDAGGVSIESGTGQSYDLVSPPFDARGQDVVWLHMDLSAQLNNNGQCVVDVDVTGDDGATWHNVWRRVAPQRGMEPFPVVDIPDGLPGGPQTGNADGYFGRLHLDLSEHAAGAEKARFRVRHFEPNYDWWVAVDNVVVDSRPVVEGTATLLETETFFDGIPDEWVVETDEGLATWMTEDLCGLSLLNSAEGLFPDAADGRQLHHFDETFAFVYSGESCFDTPGDEWLLTPIIDATDREAVYLYFRSAIVPVGNTAEVLLSLDGGDTFLTEAPIFSYSLGAAFDPDEDPFYGEYIFEVPEAAGESEVVFAFHYENVTSDLRWWAIDDVRVTADGGGTTDPDPQFRRGDSDASGELNITDGIYVLNFLFLGGPDPSCLDAADADDSGAINITDGIYILNFLFLGGTQPPAPGPETCGVDPESEDDTLGCESYPGCAGV